MESIQNKSESDTSSIKEANAVKKGLNVKAKEFFPKDKNNSQSRYILFI